MWIKLENFLEFAAGDSRKLEFGFKFALNRDNHEPLCTPLCECPHFKCNGFDYNEMITKGDIELYPRIPYAILLCIRGPSSTTIPPRVPFSFLYDQVVLLH